MFGEARVEWHAAKTSTKVNNARSLLFAGATMVYIKNITIQGFKSYRDQTQVDPFSPGHNVVVGRNGSGKSNFFAAIRFVLNDAYTSMGKEERQSLLHEGVSATTTLSAWVEIIFDNSDNRFPTGHPEVIIRRTIGSKKDEYSLDKKSVSKADVMNLLESAGFSRANPYYIVPQGRITSLTNAKESDRLNLLKEVAGTKVYEQRRSESLKLMEETETKRSKIGDLLDYIEERLSELEEEKEELKEFQNKDRERRCLEYALYSRELDEVVATLDEIQEERKAEMHNSHKRRDEFNKRAEDVVQLESSIVSTKQSINLNSIQKKGLTSELNDLVRSKTELECVVADLEKANEATGGKKEEVEAELKGVEKRIKKVQRDLETARKDWMESKEQEGEERKKLDAAKARLNTLYAKQQNLSRFASKRDRDNFLQSEIDSLKAYMQTQNQVLESKRKYIEAGRTKLDVIESRGSDLMDSLEERRNKMKEIATKVAKIQEEKASLNEKLKEHWREDAKLESVVTHAKDQLRTAERDLGTMMDKDTGSGIRAIDRIVEKHGIRGVYGPLYRLLNVPDKRYNTVVELTAGNSLFHVVVDSDDTAQKVLNIMLKEKTGRVTFMPLNRLKPKIPTFPQSTDAIPLLSKIEYDEQYERAFQQVFGKTAVCKDLTIAAAYSRSHGLNTITLEGDKVERKGAMTGGWHDIRRSRLEAAKSLSKWSETLEKEGAKSKEVKQSITRIDQETTRLTGQIQILESQKLQAQSSREPLMAEAAQLDREKLMVTEKIAKLEKEVEGLEADLVDCQSKAESYQVDLKKPMENSLTRAEEELIAALSKEVDDRKRSWSERVSQKNEIESKRNVLEIEMNENLKKKREELRTKLDNIGIGSSDTSGSVEDLDSRKRELKNLNGTIDNLRKQEAALDKDIEKLTAKLHELRSDLEKSQSQQTEDSRLISRQQKNTERYQAKRQILLTRKEECNRNIRDLGVLPEQAFEKYVNDKLDRIVKKLHSVNEGLKKFSHVNKKAFEQYNNFTKQRDQLLERREDLDKSASSIQDLIQVLDQRKDEAIERTFKQVAKNFEEVFEKLVPAGRGKLIIQKKIDRDEMNGEDDGEESPDSVDNYTGVSIKVSFNSKVDEGLRIQQLSGGQKSLVALATVFAIQKCDPAPFYLFDEIDANLDAQYRTAVASMIHALSSTAQFITTTFRAEMLTEADKFYGVLFNNQKVSSIRVISRDEAQQFVDTEMQAQ